MAILLINGENLALQLRHESFVIIEEAVCFFEGCALFIVDIVKEVLGEIQQELFVGNAKAVLQRFGCFCSTFLLCLFVVILGARIGFVLNMELFSVRYI